MTIFTKMKLWLLTMLIVVGSGVAWGAEGDLIYTLDLAAQSSAFGTSNSYAAKTGTVSSVTWYANAASCQSSSAVWIGTNNATNRTNLTILSDGVNSRGAAIASALSTFTSTSITTSTVGYYAIVAGNAISNVGSIKVKAATTGGTAPSTLWCLYTTDGGTTYTVLGSKAAPGTTEQTFTPATTISSAQYAFVFYSSAFGTYRTPYFKFYEGAASSCTALGTPSVTPSAGNTQATLSWDAVANATSYTLIWNGGSPETVTSPVTKTGLTNGTSYSYSIMAVGDGTTYCATNTPATGNVTPVAPSYTITPSSNNESFGTVSLSGTVITGAPVAGYTYASPAYTVLSGTATVSQNGNAFTVTPTSNCAVRINFEALPTYTVTFDKGTGNCATASLTESPGGVGVTLPTATPSASCASQNWEFAGWAAASQSESTSSPTLYLAGSTYNPVSNLTLYAVYKVITGGGSGTVTINRNSLPSGTGYTESTWTSVASTGETITGKMTPFLTTATHIQLRNTSEPFPYNDVATPGSITNITMTMPGSGTVRAWTPYMSTNTTLSTSTEGTALATQTFANSSGSLSWDIDPALNYKYFNLSLAGGSTNIASFVISYGSSTTTYNSNPSCSNPTVSVNETTLSGFTYAQGSGPSSEQSFTVSGSNLTNNISIAATTNYEISKTSGSGYTSPLTFTPAEATTPQTVYVRLKNGLTQGSFNDEVINITSTGADAKTVTVSGSVTAAINPEPTAHVTGFGAVEDGQNAIIVDWTDAAGADGYLIKVSTVSYAAITAPVDGTPESNGTLVKNVAQGDEIVEFAGLAAGTTYYFKIWPYSNSGASIDYKTDGSVPEASATTEAPVSGLQLSNANTKYTIDFDNTVNNVNNGQFAGTGFTPTPTIGQLNSSSWAMTGWSFGSLIFGGTRSSDDYARGLSSIAVGTGGVYAFTVSEGNNALGFQPGGSDWAPGTVTLKLQNKTGAAINTLSVAYNVYIRNDQGRSSSFGFSHSEDDISYTDISSLLLTSAQAADASPAWKKYYRSAELSSLNIPNNAYYYIRWSGADVGGSGSRDEFALDDIQLIANPTSVKPEISGVVEDLIVEGDLEIATSLTVNNKLTVTGNLTNNGTLTLKSDANGTATLLNEGTVSIGSYVVEQYLAASRNWYVASPLSNANALGAGFEYWQYNEPNGSLSTNWTAVDENDPLVAGRGYIVKPSAETTYAFSTSTGTLNTGEITVPLTRTAGVTKSGFNLVGNPYPSYLNLNDLLAGDLETSYWMRGRNAGNAWVFDSFNKDGNVPVNNSGKAVTTYVPPMQSFWVRVKTGVESTNLVFNNTMRDHIDIANNRFRAPQNTPLIRLEMSNGTSTDQTVLYTHANASDDLDSYDTYKMLNNSASVPDIYSMVGTQKLVINGMSALPLNVEMPLGILVKQAGSFSIRASEVRAIDADIVLIDKLNSNAEWLLNGGAEYQFASSATTHAERFALVLRAPGTTTGECCNDILGAQTMVFVDAFKYINISCSMAVNKSANVAVYNAVGQTLMQQKLENGSARIAVNANGVYLVEITVDGAKTTKRVIVK